MRTEVLQYIVEVDKEQSISQAARNLFISKSALSESISQLEQELNVAIFIRKKKGIATTETGQKFIAQAKSVLQELEKFYTIGYTSPALVDYDEAIKFGISEKFAKAGLNTCLSLVIHKYPKLNLRTVSMNYSGCIDGVANGDLAFAVIAYPTDLEQEISKLTKASSIVQIPMHDDNFFCLVNKNSPVAQKSAISSKDYNEYTMISYGDIVPEEIFGRQKLILLSELDNILQMVNDNVGIAPLPFSLIKNSDISGWDNITTIPVADSIQRNCIIYSSKRPLTTAQSFFVNLYKRVFDKIFSS